MWVSSCLGGGLCHVMLGPGYSSAKAGERQKVLQEPRQI